MDQFQASAATSDVHTYIYCSIAARSTILPLLLVHNLFVIAEFLVAAKCCSISTLFIVFIVVHFHRQNFYILCAEIWCKDTLLNVSVSVLRLNQRNSQLEAESAQCRHGVSELRAKYEELLLTDASKMAVDEHINTVAALKQYVLAL